MNWWKKMFKESVGNSEVRKELPDVSKKEWVAVVDEEIQTSPDGITWTAPDDSTVTEDIEMKIPMRIKPLDLMKVSYEASPNKSTRRGAVKYIVLHHTGPGSFNGIVNWLCDPAAKASAHYVLGTGGQLKQLVNTGKEAWHAGVSKWDGERINNHKSIGIEICNIGRMEAEDDGSYYYEQGRSTKKYTGKVKPESGSIVYPDGSAVSGFYVPYPEKQLKKLIALCKALIIKYPEITWDNILMHYEVAQPIGRKNDPFGLDLEAIKCKIFM